MTSFPDNEKSRLFFFSVLFIVVRVIAKNSWPMGGRGHYHENKMRVLSIES